MGYRKTTVDSTRRSYFDDWTDERRAATAKRNQRIVDLAERGLTRKQVAELVGLSANHISTILCAHNTGKATGEQIRCVDTRFTTPKVKTYHQRHKKARATVHAKATRLIGKGEQHEGI